MTRVTVILAAVLSLAFTPLAAQGNCFDADAWKDATVIDVALCLVVTDVNARDEDGYTPLHNAALYNENPEVFTVLLDAGADVNARNKVGSTPLHYAASHAENPDVLTVLLDAGADVNARDEDGVTPLHKAASQAQNPDVLTVLLDAGADGAAVNDDGETPFDKAKDNDALAGTDAYWALNDARFE